MGGALSGSVSSGKGVKKYKLQNSHGGIKYSIRNIATSVLITMHGVRGTLDLSGWLFCELQRCLITIYVVHRKLK